VPLSDVSEVAPISNLLYSVTAASMTARGYNFVPAK
jgi:hypothetical protein